MTTTFQIALRGPGGEQIDLWRTLNSHGFADLPPTFLDEAGRSLSVTLRTRGRPRRVRIKEGRRGGAHIEILGPQPGDRVRLDVETGVRRVLRLDQDLSAFYARAADDPDLSWVTAGAGRMLRSPPSGRTS